MGEGIEKDWIRLVLEEGCTIHCSTEEEIESFLKEAKDKLGAYLLAWGTPTENALFKIKKAYDLYPEDPFAYNPNGSVEQYRVIEVVAINTNKTIEWSDCI